MTKLKEQTIIQIIDNEKPSEIADHINNGEFTWTDLNNALVNTCKGMKNTDTDLINLFFKRERKVDASQAYLEA